MSQTVSMIKGRNREKINNKKSLIGAPDCLR